MNLIDDIPGTAPSIKELGGEAWSMVENTPERSFNASLGYSPEEGYAMVVRKSNYKLDLETGLAHVLTSGERRIRNITGFSYLDENMNPVKWKKVVFPDGPVQERGVEDARLFWRDNSWYIHCVFLERNTPRARIAIYKLNADLTANFIEMFDSDRGSDAIEKNWMTELYTDSSNIEWIKVNPNGIRGGSSLLTWGDGYLALTHRTYSQSTFSYSSKTFGEMKGATKHYRHLFAKYDSDKNLVATSKEFTFRPEGQVEFGMGLVDKGDDLYMSLGVNDEEVWMAKLSKSKVKQLLKEKHGTD